MWVNPIALVGIAAIAVPVLIHILVRRRATPLPFPTLRFLQPTRLAAVRRHVLEDLPLLVVRAAMLAAAAVALAGPLLVTPARVTAWNARLAQGIVVSPSVDSALSWSDVSPTYTESFRTSDLRAGIAHALAWLETVPPSKRELVIASPFPAGSLTRADLRDVPADIGIRLVRSGELPPSRKVTGAPTLILRQAQDERRLLTPLTLRQAQDERRLLTPLTLRQAQDERRSLTPLTLSPSKGERPVLSQEQTIELRGPSTLVREGEGVPADVPIEIVAADDVKRVAEQTLAAALSQRVLAPAPGRKARLVFGSSAPVPHDTPTLPWIAEAIAALTRDDRLPPFAAASDGDWLVVSTGVDASSLQAARLLRSILNALAARPDRTTLAEREVLRISDADLRAWERPAHDVRRPGPVPRSGWTAGPAGPALRTEDDRRWWWGAVIVLLIVETWLRRTRSARAEGTLTRVA